MAKTHGNDTQQEMFGGAWTQQKLEYLHKYLKAYTTIFKRNVRAQYFSITYVDAFAGTGYMRLEVPEFPLARVLPEFADIRDQAESAAEEYKKGSVIRALEVTPSFNRYLFIERDAARMRELTAIRDKFPEKKSRIDVVNADANHYLLEWCATVNWKNNRAVVFLDPFGMQVEWTLVESIAKTEAIDLWFLFPLFATNRLLVAHGTPPAAWARRLTLTFGTDKWQEEFYHTRKSQLIQGITITEKVAHTSKIADFFLQRLRTVFAAVAPPLILRNSKGSPLFLFCFAAGNKRGAPTAVKIATDIIGG